MILNAHQTFLLPSEAPPPPPTSGLTPRDYQLAGIGAARKYIAEGVRRILLVLATGGGKTVVAALVALGAMQKGKRILFVGPRREIIAQAFWKLVEAGIPEMSCGVIMADGVIPHVSTREPYLARRASAPVQVASIQTLANRKLPPADVVFIDEAHHATSETWAKIIAHYTDTGAVIVGLTATPCRADGAGLGKLFDKLHVIASFADLASKGFLVVPRVFTTPRAPDLSKVRLTRTGEYDQEQLSVAMRDRALVGDVVEHWQRHAEGRTTVVFAASVEHSKELAGAFERAGVASGHIDANTDPEERDATLARLARGEITVLCNMQVVTEGWDLPRCKCVVLARPTKSLSLFLQMAGRGLRPWNDTSAILLDHAGAVHEHGFPSDEREWDLEGRVKRKAAVSVRTCPKCYAALPSGSRSCSECDHVFPVEVREVPEQVDGTLLEARPLSRAELRDWYRGVLTEAASSGRKLGWARHRYKEQFSAWPRFGALEREFYARGPTGAWMTIAEAQAQALLVADEDAPPAPAEEPVVIPSLSEIGIEAPVTRARRINLDALLAAEPPSASPQSVEAWTL